MGAPLVRLLLEAHADDASRVELAGLVLHAGHGQLPGLVEGLGEVGKLHVLADRTQRLGELAMGDVVHAGPHHQALGHVARLHERPEVLAREIGGEGLALRVAIGVAVLGLDRGPESDELGRVVAPLVVVDVEADADDAVGAELVASSSMRFMASSRAVYMASVSL